MKTSGFCLLTAATIVFALAAPTPASQNAENGVLLPTRGMVRVLVVFAELTGVPPGTPPAAQWVKTSTGVPVNADQYFDLVPMVIPQAYLTDYYHQGTFGEYDVVGDYVKQLIQVPYNSASPDHHIGAVLTAVSSLPPPIANSGLALSGFDNWTLTSAGQPKVNSANNKVDCVLVIFGNNPSWGNNSGFGVQNLGWSNTAFAGFDGIEAMGAWNAYFSDRNGMNFFIAEYFHALFGGNNWHTSNGAGSHSFIESPATFSTTAQSGSTSNAFCGFDRNHLGWKDPAKAYLISALDTSSGLELPSDMSIQTYPNGIDFRLRDAQLTGDAVRIKLPHIDYLQGVRPVKNQYLWLENHRLQLSLTPYVHNFDIIGGDGTLACQEASTPSLYAYLQIGKDVKTGNQIYTTDPWAANGLGSWLYPLPGEGRFDFRFRPDLTLPGDDLMECNWGNASIPIDSTSGLSEPNPLSGHSELACIFDQNGDGALFSGDDVSFGLSELLRDGTIASNWWGHGDGQDFLTKLGIDTNPAPVPVYTLTRPLNMPAGQPASYENRTIFLNGIRVQPYAEGVDGSLFLSIRFDDYAIAEDVRWCGNIVLRNDADDPLNRQSRIDLTSGHMIHLDQGRSALLPSEQDLGGDKAFADPTILTLEAGTEMKIADAATCIVYSGSTLRVCSGAWLTIEGAGRLIVERGAYLCVEDGATVTLAAASRILMHEGAIAGTHPILGLSVLCLDPCSMPISGAGMVQCDIPCYQAPIGMIGWWPLDGNGHGSSGYNAADIAWGNDGNSNSPGIVSRVETTRGRVGRGAEFDGLASQIFVRDADKLDIGTKPLSIAAWVRTHDESGLVVILDKRAEFLSQTYGYHLYLKDGRLSLQLADGVYSNYESTHFVADGLWHHVAVTVKRSLDGGRFYVDGREVGRFDPSDRPGTLSNSGPLVIGRRGPQNSGHLRGTLDEVQVYDVDLTESQVRALFEAGRQGVCKEYCHVPMATSYCQSDTQKTISVLVCNERARSETYLVEAVGLPADGQSCTVDGPTLADISYPNGLLITVAAGECATVPITIARPAGLTGTGLSSCYEVVVTNTASGRKSGCRASLRTGGYLCFSDFSDPVGAEVGHPFVPGFEITNTAAFPVLVNLSIVGAAMSAQAPTQLSVNGLAPGQPYMLAVALPSNATAQVPCFAILIGNAATLPQDLVLSADLDGDGIPEGLSSRIVIGIPAKEPKTLGYYHW